MMKDEKLPITNHELPFRFEIRLQNYHSGKCVMMTRALFSRDAKLDTGGAGILRAEGFIPKLNGDVRLVFEFVGKATRAATSRVWVAVLVERLTDDNQADVVLRGKVGNLRGVNDTRDMLNYLERAGDGHGLVAEGKTDSLFAVVNG
jgi:hypothetical protein